MSQKLIKAILDMNEVESLTLTSELLENGTSPLEIMAFCRSAMDVIGKRFEKGEAFIPELMLGGEILGQITKLIKPRIEQETGCEQKLAKIVIGTVEGDIHDIAKDIVAFMLDINGFDVMDLGVDIPPTRFVEAAREFGADIVALSGFLTLCYEPMKETIKALKADGQENIKVMIGGGQINDQVCDYTGADAFGRDAMAAVNLAKEWTGVLS